MWTLDLRHHHHSQILGSPSKYSQRHTEQGCAYNVKGDGGGELKDAFKTAGDTQRMTKTVGKENLY